MTSPKQRRIQAMAAGGYDLSGRHQSWDIMANFVRYDPLTGVVLESGSMAAAAVDKMREQPGRHYLKGSGTRTDHFVDLSSETPELKRKTACPASLTGTIFTDLPIPCVVSVVDESEEQTDIECDEGVINLSFDYGGTYVITISAAQYMNGVFTIEV